MTTIWRRASISMKFAVVILIAGGVIAVIPLWLANNNTQSAAIDRAVDKVGIASNLVQGQRSSLQSFIAGVARQIVATHDVGDPVATESTLAEDAGVNASGDVIGVVQPDRTFVAVEQGSVLTRADPLTIVILDAVAAERDTVAAPDAGPWLVEVAEVPGTGATAFVARPVSQAFLSAIDHNIATAADPADLAVLRGGGRVAVGGTIAGAPVSVGATVSGALSNAVQSSSRSVLGIGDRQVAVAGTSLGAGYTMVVTTPVAGIATSLEPVLLLLALILIAMLFIVVVVQTDLQRPLRRLDRAVAALGRGDFDVSVPAGSDDEVGRLGETFDAMRRQLRSTMRATAARASVATELSAPQPLESALAKVSAELRRSMVVDAVIILVNGSEMTDPFAVVDGVRDIDIETYLSGDGPLGEGHRHAGAGAMMLGAAPASAEALLGMREYCVAPLRLGNHVHGVLAVANAGDGFHSGDAELIGTTAEQIALALERYRFLAVVQRQASVDDLTGLYNHRFLVDYLSQQVALAERLGAPLAILMIDIDHFKVLNDTHGHQAGDSALATFAQTLLSSVRRADLAARYGGEEFAVVMANTSAAEARLVAEKIRTAVAEAEIAIPGRGPLRLTVSIGGAAFPEDTETAGELLSLADEALYTAKRSGRNRTCMTGDSAEATRRRNVVA